jgi:hypothetical protein
MINRSRCIGLFVATAMAAGILMGTGCTEKANPAGPSTGKLDTVNRVVFWHDSTFADPTLYSVTPFKLSLNDTITKLMSFNAAIGKKNWGSMYSTANNQAHEYDFSIVGGDPVMDSILGMEFYLMAISSAKTNFIAFLGIQGGSDRNSIYYVGMGFDKSDSIKILWSSLTTAEQENHTLSPIAFGGWYKCTVEYNFVNFTTTYYIDNKKVGTNLMPSASTNGYNMFVVYRDALGQDGTAPYYLNDLTLYKIQKKNP